MNSMGGIRFWVATMAFAAAAVVFGATVIEAVRIDGRTVHVTLSHPDTGWDHYADGWEVLDARGARLGLRVLAHPHVDEQPFTRSLRLDAPPPPGPLFVRARCSIDGWALQTVPLARD